MMYGYNDPGLEAVFRDFQEMGLFGNANGGGGSFNFQSKANPEHEAMLQDFREMGFFENDTRGNLNCGPRVNAADIVYEDFDSTKSREEGNQFYCKGKYFQAISSYTKAYAQAEEGTKDRALALANRSAVLMAVGFYKVFTKEYFIRTCMHRIDFFLKEN